MTLKPDDDLNRMLSELQLAEFIYEQPAVGDTEYIFKHALTQQVAYESMLSERRRSIHEQTAASIEAMRAVALDEHAAELAFHYGRAGNHAQAVRWLQQAATKARELSAYHDAMRFLREALNELEAMFQSESRDHLEISVELSLGYLSR